MKSIGIWVATGLMAASPALHAAQLYQWKDAQGRTVYSDQAPPSTIKNAQQKTFRPSVIEGGESYALQAAREKFPVTLYTSACGPTCDQARQLLDTRGIPYSNKDLQTDLEAQKALVKLTGQARVPVLVVGKDKIEGFEAGQWNAALDRAGYPKSPGLKRAPAGPSAKASPPTPPVEPAK